MCCGTKSHLLLFFSQPLWLPNQNLSQPDFMKKIGKYFIVQKIYLEGSWVISAPQLQHESGDKRSEARNRYAVTHGGLFFMDSSVLVFEAVWERPEA
jgi:hypothetical protein